MKMGRVSLHGEGVPSQPTRSVRSVVRSPSGVRGNKFSVI